MESIQGHDQWKTTPPDNRPCPDCVYDEAQERVTAAVFEILGEVEGGSKRWPEVKEAACDLGRDVADIIRDLTDTGDYCRRHRIEDWD